ncbi:hypothetical protein PCCS19_14540 [Paenibacillus sp. CCS19]|uniref:hypothetical protein n=1 Tax=Paenibacillus sp. CCS19 TaxID=3158387 RepID=UPI0025685DD6|nr:hypothetical protein [Paenibacillus cellulosilyticus]GMK38400.1 hypothetical protein PCCS19_14540 [Paenibacillus cellulosilyticus]
MELIRKQLWLVLLLIGLSGFAFVWLVIPREPEIENVWHLLAKLVSYLFIIGSISFFPNKLKYGHLMVYVPFLVFLGYLIPRVSFFGVTGNVIVTNFESVGEWYTLLYLLVVQMINFTVSFAYRMGGGTPGKTMKISLLATVTLFSGFLDLAFYTINPVEIPEEGLIYAHHIIVLTGTPLSYNETIVFALCHLPLFLFVMWMPLDRWFKRISERVQNREQQKSVPTIAS